MIRNGKGGGNTKTGLIFEGKTDLETFLSKQKGYNIKAEQETVLFKGKNQNITVRNVYYNSDKVAELYKKNEFYAVLLKKLNIEWEQYISKKLLPDIAFSLLLEIPYSLLNVSISKWQARWMKNYKPAILKRKNIKNYFQKQI